MSGPVNLNKARKARARAEDKARADANAASHGLGKAERIFAATRNAKAARALDRHKREDE